VRWLACAPGPNFSVYDLHVGYSEALKAAGETVIDFPLGSAITFYDSVFIQTGPHEVRKALDGQKATELAADRLAGALWKVRPDVLLITSGFFVDPVLLDIARADGVRIVLVATEQPYELTRELGIASHCDIALLTDPTTIGHFEQVCTARHQPHCYRPSVHRPGPARPELAADLAFIGTAYQSRIEFFEGMDLAGLDVMLAGNWQQLGDDSPLRTHVVGNPDDCLDNERTADVYGPSCRPGGPSGHARSRWPPAARSSSATGDPKATSFSRRCPRSPARRRRRNTSAGISPTRPPAKPPPARRAKPSRAERSTTRQLASSGCLASATLLAEPSQPSGVPCSGARQAVPVVLAPAAAVSGIGLAEFVPAVAMRSGVVPGVRRVASQHVDPLRHRFEVCRPVLVRRNLDARPIAALAF
jgi:hypothetical protein